jgi:hypothetical protein
MSKRNLESYNEEFISKKQKFNSLKSDQFGQLEQLGELEQLDQINQQDGKIKQSEQTEQLINPIGTSILSFPDFMNFQIKFSQVAQEKYMSTTERYILSQLINKSNYGDVVYNTAANYISKKQEAIQFLNFYKHVCQGMLISINWLNSPRVPEGIINILNILVERWDSLVITPDAISNYINYYKDKKSMPSHPIIFAIKKIGAAQFSNETDEPVDIDGISKTLDSFLLQHGIDVENIEDKQQIFNRSFNTPAFPEYNFNSNQSLKSSVRSLTMLNTNIVPKNSPISIKSFKSIEPSLLNSRPNSQPEFIYAPSMFSPVHNSPNILSHNESIDEENQQVENNSSDSESESSVYNKNEDLDKYMFTEKN